MIDFSKLEKKLGIDFENKDLLKKAFCHRSYLNEHPDFPLNHNERLEFLGDAVIELAITENLFKDFPKKTEGSLTSWRAALVNSRMLSKIAGKLKFGDFLLLSKGEKKEAEKKGKSYQEILANTFEAFVGALYMDGGYLVSKKFLDNNLFPELEDLLKNNLFKDAKSRLQEISQEKEGITPSYQVLKEEGPDHYKKFIAGVFLGEDLVAKGEGYSKQEAEEKSANKALKKKGWDNN